MTSFRRQPRETLQTTKDETDAWLAESEDQMERAINLAGRRNVTSFSQTTKTTTMQLMTARLTAGHMTTSVTCASNSSVTVYNRGTRCCAYRHVHGPSTMQPPDGASMSHFSDSYRHMLRFVRPAGLARDTSHPCDTRHPPLHKEHHCGCNCQLAVVGQCQHHLDTSAVHAVTASQEMWKKSG